MPWLAALGVGGGAASAGAGAGAAAAPVAGAASAAGAGAAGAGAGAAGAAGAAGGASGAAGLAGLIAPLAANAGKLQLPGGLQTYLQGGTEAAHLRALGQTVPTGVDLVGPSSTFQPLTTQAAAPFADFARGAMAGYLGFPSGGFVHPAIGNLASLLGHLGSLGDPSQAGRPQAPPATYLGARPIYAPYLRSY